MAADLVLRNHSVSAAGDTQEHVEFKPTVEWRRLVTKLPAAWCAIRSSSDTSSPDAGAIATVGFRQYSRS